MAPKRRVPPSSGAPEGSGSAPSGPSASGTSAPISFTAKSPPQEIVLGVWQRYTSHTPQRILLLDAFMGFLVAVGALQFIYCILAGNYPFNAFLSGFSAAVGQFVLTASLRMQTSEQSANPGLKRNAVAAGDSGKESSERAFADYIFGSVILHFFCVNFIN